MQIKLSSASTPDAIIVAAGDFPAHEVPLSLLDSFSDRIICCDGAANELFRRGYYPIYGTGDGDSISSLSMQRLADRFILNPEQMNNDLTKAVLLALTQGMKNIAILGATGKREDHTLGNISLMTHYMKMANVTMFTDYGFLVPFTGEATVDIESGRQISFFCMDASPLTVTHLKYPITHRVFDSWWQGTLNETTGSNMTIKTNGRIVIFVKYEV